MARKVRRGLAWSVLLAAGLVLGAASEAAAERVDGIGLVVAKDRSAHTVEVAPDTVLHVESHTRILDAEGLVLPLVALPVAHVGDEGGVLAEGDATVRYEAVRRDDRLVAESIRVLGERPR